VSSTPGAVNGIPLDAREGAAEIPLAGTEYRNVTRGWEALRANFNDGDFLKTLLDSPGGLARGREVL